MMLKKVSLCALALTAATVAAPQVAQAQRYPPPGYAVPPPGPGYYGRNYARPYGYYRQCGGTTGAIIGGAAGAILGHEIGRQSGGYRYDGNGGYYKKGNGTVGAILGGAAGALLGREIDRSSC